jgi:hypothetical protein
MWSTPLLKLCGGRACIYFFLCVLFHDAVSSSDYITLNDRLINE